MKEHKLFFTILSYFFSLLVPILVIGSIMYVNVDRLVKKDVSDKLQANLRSSISTIDVYLEMVRTTHNNLLINDIVQTNLKPYSLQTAQDRINAPSIIRTIAANRNTLGSFVDTIVLFNDVERVYTADGVVDFATFFNKFYVMAGYTQSYWEDQLTRDRFFQVLPPTDISSPSNAVHRVIPEVTTQYVNGHLMTSFTTIRTQSILNALRDSSLYDSTVFLVADADNRPMMSSDEWNAGRTGEVKRAFSQPDASAERTIRFAGRPYVVTHLSSESFGWNYYSMTPASAFDYELSSILTLILWICASLVLIGIAFSLIFSLRLYNPIRNIRDILLRDGSSPGSDEPERARGGLHDIHLRVHRLLEEKLDISERLHHVANERVQHYLRDLIEGRSWPDANAGDQLAKELGFSGGSYLICCFMFQFRERFYREIGEAERVLILEKLKVVLGAILHRHVTSCVVEFEHNLYAAAVNLRTGDDRDKLNAALETIRQTFEYDMVYCELSIGIGNVYGEIGGLADSYVEAVTALDRKTLRPDVRVVDAADLEIERVYYYSFMDEARIVNALKLGEFELLHREIETLVESNRGRDVSLANLGALLADIYLTGYRYLTERRQDIYGLVTEREHRTLLSKDVLPPEWPERMELLYGFFAKAIESTAVKTERRSGQVVALITEYISLHYDKDLHLELIADEIGLSPKYVSRLYKDAMGSSITDTISRTRMEKAKELLLDTDLKVAYIAERIGIHSRTTFLRLFKKYEGVSPLDYRNAHGRKGGAEM